MVIIYLVIPIFRSNTPLQSILLNHTPLGSITDALGGYYILKAPHFYICLGIGRACRRCLPRRDGIAL